MKITGTWNQINTTVFLLLIDMFIYFFLIDLLLIISFFHNVGAMGLTLVSFDQMIKYQNQNTLFGNY